ncbi:hypothetical protein HZY83_01805 [Gemella sp. GH3]|uniref:hypothetical protein n=1 Tax=unclassified Gemella TaxID=2624949 RepID=UPI0015D0AAF0|nr:MULTISPECIES: hypothetical protein [unclassified Gemella]MBF0713422.1 hypothetical protein [Gemella sp. GH3.1]NYS50374.1 hypothetical protein [Gemella sp. GH3]
MKKIIWRTVLVVLLGILIFGYVKINLKSNAVYYAKNMLRGEGQEPELIMLIDNLWWVDNPDIEGIQYKIDGTQYVIYENNSFGSISSYEEDRMDYMYSNEEGISYSFNRRFELVHVMNFREWKRIDINSVDKNKIVSEIKSLVQPVIDKQSEPLINLQWIFNLVYQDEFK